MKDSEITKNMIVRITKFYPDPRCKGKLYRITSRKYCEDCKCDHYGGNVVTKHKETIYPNTINSNNMVKANQEN